MHKFMHQFLIVFFALRRPCKYIYYSPLNHPRHSHRRVVARFLYIEVIACLAQKGSQPGGRHRFFRTLQGILRHALPGPSLQVQYLTRAGINHAIAHQYKAVILLDLKTVFVDFLSLNHPFLVGIIYNFLVPDKYTGRIIIFHQIGVSVTKDLQDTECRISHLPHLADRKRFGDCRHTGFYGCAFEQHRPEYLGCQCCENVSFHTTPHSVRKNHNVGVFRL